MARIEIDRNALTIPDRFAGAFAWRRLTQWVTVGAFAALMSICLTARTFAGVEELHLPPGVLAVDGDDPASVNQFFLARLNETMDRLAAAGLDRIFKTDSGQIVTLNRLREAAAQIEFSFARNEITSGSVKCADTLDARWLTAQDTADGRPHVEMKDSFFSTVVFHRGHAYAIFRPGDFSPSIRRLFFHETISALGYVDDEYQVTAPLMNAEQLTQSSRSASQPASQPASLLALIGPVKFHVHAPTYYVDLRTNNCFYQAVGAAQSAAPRSGPSVNFDASLLGRPSLGNANLSGGGNITGVGGGGGMLSLQFKMDLLQNANAWWEKNSSSPGDAQKKKRFLFELNQLGIEPFDREATRIVTSYPIQMEFAPSKRTHRLTCYFLLEQFASGSDPRYWFEAQVYIYRHVLNVMIPAPTEKEAKRATVYGFELAIERHLLRDYPARTDSTKEQLKPFFE